MNGPAEAAREAGLRYVTDRMPGIRRRRRGKGFEYVEPGGSVVRDARELQRIRSLAVPPAYRDVWIAPQANAHIQATGRDARGRKQYRYHPRWREVRDETKYARMLEFAAALPAMRKRVARDLGRKGLLRERVLATVVRLLETTAIRVGNDEYARENGSFGLTTLRNGHATVRGQTVRFQFRGKSGIKHAISLEDARLAKIVRACQDLPGQQLFEYVDAGGAVVAVGSDEVNAYIREISGGDFTAKDFRTWLGTLECARALCEFPLAETARERKQCVVEAIARVAKRLGNTPAVCRKCYVHPELLETFVEMGALELTGSAKPSRGLSRDERFIVRLLRRRARETPQQRTRRQLRASLRR
ncbi:MAG: DNA topoisomerase IB [Candidatus Eremiobacteraeota bacterium]|nr:DNA topoisomerase IB [Candidatus Eremiobacteraeota bacterium]